MKLIIAGSRTLNPSISFINSSICHFVDVEKVTEVVSGGAKGIDIAGEVWQKEMESLCGSLAPKLTLMEAQWAAYGKAAGPIRNREMAEYADALLLIWDGESRGSANMKQEMLKLKKPVYEVILKSETPVL